MIGNEQGAVHRHAAADGAVASGFAAPFLARELLRVDGSGRAAQSSSTAEVWPTLNPSLRWPIKVDGKFFRCGPEKWFVKGLTYGPFAPGADGVHLPELSRVRSDFGIMRGLGANAIRCYHTPPEWLLDEAASAGLRVFIDVPWDKHRCFLEDWNAQREAVRRVTDAAALGNHPAVFAISTANEIPKDIVRYCGERRIERFIGELLDAAKQRAPECLVTYTNYPSTEFLRPACVDFLSFNIYLEDPVRLGAYLTRLQHLAGNLPLILGEHGFDSQRAGAATQAQQLESQLRRVFSHGLAGSFVFSFTDDWFTGGAQVQDWAFGVTDQHRREKPAAVAVRSAWLDLPFPAQTELPSVSVVVCSYNGASTLDECLQSLTKLRYDDYEIILIDDGSTDSTKEIAKRYPQVRTFHQENRGLSAARNAGARHARGEIVVYTDSDCVADEDWLFYLMHEMQRQQADLIGGPNVPPPNDCWIARCVALSPGGPSHVMIDDERSEHVPGCNLACRRDKLLELGGFDEQFRVAGDDVDICWRFIDAGHTVNYAPSALVWHHRRATVSAYLKQQSGYGKSESMLHFKHPLRFNGIGNALWSGVIYGDGSVGLPLLPPVIYHGRFGLELFPSIYRQNRVTIWAYFMVLEWHVLALLATLLGILYPPIAAAAVAMWSLTLVSIARAGLAAQLPKDAPFWCRTVICILHLLQPIVRGWSRYRYRLRNRILPHSLKSESTCGTFVKILSRTTFDLYWQSADGIGREHLLERAVQVAAEHRWKGDFLCHWEPCDLQLIGDNWHSIELRTATEEMGGGQRFTRVRTKLNLTVFAVASALAVAMWTTFAVATKVPWAQLLSIGAVLVVASRVLISRRNCRRAAVALLWHAGQRAGVNPVNSGT